MHTNFSVVDKLYSPGVLHQRSYPGGSAVFECRLDEEAVQYTTLVSWTLKWSKRGREMELDDGDAKGRFNALKGLRYLIIMNVSDDDNFLKISCQVKDSLNDVTLTSSEAYLFVDGKLIDSLQSF